VSALRWPPDQAQAAAGVCVDPLPDAVPGPLPDVAPGLPAAVTVAPLILAAVADRLPEDSTRPEIWPVITGAVADYCRRQVQLGGQVPAGEEVDELAQAVFDLRYGLGPLAPHLRENGVENIDINGCDRVFVSYATGERVAVAPVAASDEALIELIRTWAARGGQTSRAFSSGSPLVTVALPGGVRMTATMSVTPRPCVSLRRHGQLQVTLADLVALGTLDQVSAGFLAAAVRARCNIVVVGGVNAGKTTLLRALASEIPAGERIATLESEYELYLHESARHPDVIAFEARTANSEGAGSVSLHDLIAHALRHNPHRIVVGEVRQSEIMPMLEAMNSGQQGSMCTLHANSPAEMFDRILILALRGGLSLAERAIHLLVGMAVDLIVHVRKRYDGHRVIRYVAEICEVLPPGDTERPAMNRVFLPAGPGGVATWAHTPSAGLLARLEAGGFRPGTPGDGSARVSGSARTATR
jgi:Flp pilus assembly CpaF family ATPase